MAEEFPSKEMRASKENYVSKGRWAHRIRLHRRPTDQMIILHVIREGPRETNGDV
jgi:hypothetical protein